MQKRGGVNREREREINRVRKRKREINRVRKRKRERD